MRVVLSTPAVRSFVSVWKAAALAIAQLGAGLFFVAGVAAPVLGPSTHGAGMGLTIARGLVNAAGGSVWAENVAGAGARFSVSVPASVRGVTALE